MRTILSSCLLLAASALPAQAQIVHLRGNVYDGNGGPIGRGVYWVHGITVPAGKTLTIKEPFGLTVLKMDDGANIDVYGALNVTVGCHFTSIHDDLVGGDTNGNGAATSAKPGSWGGITWNSGAGTSTLKACTFRYAGKGGRAGLYVNGSVATAAAVNLDSCKFRDFAGVGVNMRFSNGLVQRCLFERCKGPAMEWQFHRVNMKNCTAQNNSGGDYILRRGHYSGWQAGTHTMSRSATMNQSGIFVFGDTLSVPRAGKLVIPPGLVLKFMSNAGIFNQGELSCQGTATAPVIFTSIDDDTVGGDTNKNGSATKPVAGNWRGVDCNTNNKNQVIRHAEIRYPGYWGWGLELLGSPATVSNVRFFEIKGDAIKINAGATTMQTITDCRMERITGMAFQGIPWDSLGTCARNTLYQSQKGHIEVWGRITRNTTISPENYPGTLVHVAGVTRPPAGVRLRFLAGVKLKVMTLRGGDIQNFFGALDILGTGRDPVIMTTITDDTVEGDTNGDGNATTPRAGDWSGVQFVGNQSANTMTSRCEHAVVKYARYGVWCQHPKASVRNVRVEYCNTSGFEIGDMSGNLENPVALRCRDGIVLKGDNFNVYHATVSESTRYGFFRTSTSYTGKILNSISWKSGTNNYQGLTQSDVMNSCGGFHGNNGNINRDPKFVHPVNLRLNLGSPCINTGDRAAGMVTVMDHIESSRLCDHDFSGNDAPDMGAYEVVGMRLASNKRLARLGDQIAVWVVPTLPNDTGSALFAVGLMDNTAYLPTFGMLTAGVNTLFVLATLPTGRNLVLKIPLNAANFVGTEFAIQAVGSPSRKPTFGNLTNRYRTRVVR